MLTRLFFADVLGVRVDRLWREAATVHLEVTTTRPAARCPLCGRRSTRVHSHYHRTIADLPCGPEAVLIHLHTRRFFCRVRWCRRKIFTERLPALVAPAAQRTTRQRSRLEEIGFALGGNAGADQADKERLVVSARTLLRLVRAAPLPASAPVRVVGIDDFALRKGQRYGTIIVDEERHRVIDLLPDRTAATAAAWLRCHPEIEIISRDRGGAYADAARQGAPQARQVADRFHLVKNVTEALERYLARHHAVLRQAARRSVGVDKSLLPAPSCATDESLTPAAQERSAPPVLPAEETPETSLPTRVQREQQVRRARRTGLYENVRALRAQGYGSRTIARQTGASRSTVQRFLRADTFPERRARPPQSVILTPFLPYLAERWHAGCHNAQQLWRDLAERGFTGSERTVRAYVGAWRSAPPRRSRAGQSADREATPQRLRVGGSPRQTCWILLRPEEELTADEQAYRTHLFHLCPQLAVAHALTQEFRTLIHERDVPGLYAWLHGLALSAIPEFEAVARSMWLDRAAVEAALTEEWSQGQTEGKVNKLKTLARAMYGRSHFDLLRRRVLHAA